MPSPSKTRRNSPKQLTATQKQEIRNSLTRFANAQKKMNTVSRRFNVSVRPSAKVEEALRKMLAQGGGTRRRRR
jgi:hypothetical protein